MLKARRQANIDLVQLALAALLLCALALSFGSNGVVKNGDEDDGSGLGGTGRMLAPGGESGLGGTGFKPYLGMSDSGSLRIVDTAAAAIEPLVADISIPADARQPVLVAPVESPFEIAASSAITTDSSAIHIAEAIQRDADTNVLLMTRGKIDNHSGIVVEQAVVPDFGRLQENADITARTPESESQAHAENQKLGNAASAEANQDDEDHDLSWNALLGALRNQPQSSQTTESVASYGTEARIARPERVQRPVLPPVQRVRPIQRAGLLPPPIRPLRL